MEVLQFSTGIKGDLRLDPNIWSEICTEFRHISPKSWSWKTCSQCCMLQGLSIHGRLFVFSIWTSSSAPDRPFLLTYWPNCFWDFSIKCLGQNELVWWKRAVAVSTVLTVLVIVTGPGGSGRVLQVLLYFFCTVWVMMQHMFSVPSLGEGQQVFMTAFCRGRDSMGYAGCSLCSLSLERFAIGWLGGKLYPRNPGILQNTTCNPILKVNSCIFTFSRRKPQEPYLAHCPELLMAGEPFLLGRPWCWKMRITHFCRVSPKGASFFLLLYDYRSLIKRASGVKQEDASL